MAKTNRRHSRSRQYASRRSSGSGAKWVIVGIVVGALGMLFLWPKAQQPSSSSLLLTEHQHHSKLAVKKYSPPAPHKAKIAEYDFYTMLPKMEVKTVENRPLPAAIPAVQPVQPIRTVAQPASINALPTTTETVPPAPVTKSQPSPVQVAEALPPAKIKQPANEKVAENYTVQVANVRNYAEADRLKAELTMLGFEVSLQDYTVNGQTWNRVLAGSFSSKQAAIQQQKRLKQNNIVSTLMKE